MKNNNTNVHTITIPPVSKEFIKVLRTIYPKIVVKADTPIDNIKWNAAQQEILDFIERQATGTTVSGDGKAIKQDTTNSALDKALGDTK